MLSTWPLVGRREELGTIEEALHTGAAGVVLAGASGVGKTRLAQEALALAQAVGWPTAWAVATHSAAAVPFGALAHLLPHELGMEDPGRRLGRTNVLRLAADGLRQRSDDRLAIGVDDAHLLDPLSAALLHHLALRGAAFLVASVRTGAPAPDAVTALWKDDLVERIEVRALTRAETGELLEAVLDSQVAGSTSHRLWKATQGNPMLLRELMLGALQWRTLAEDGGVWRWQGPVPELPRLAEVVESRLAGLTADQWTAVEILGIAEYLGASNLASVCDARTLEILEQRGIIFVSADGRRRVARLSHPIYGEVVRARMPSARIQTLERLLADAVEAVGARRRDDLIRVAFWRLESGGEVRPDILTAAGRRSMGLLEFPQAERFARAALEAGGGFSASLILAEALIGQGRAEEAQTLLEELEDMAASDLDRVQVAIARTDNLFWRLARPAEAENVLRRTEPVVADTGLRDKLAASRGTILLFAGRTDEATELLTKIVDRSGASDVTRVQAAPALVWALSIAGRPVDAAKLGRRVLATSIRSPERNWFAPVWLRSNLCAADLFAGKLVQAEEGLERLYEEAVEWPEWLRGIFAFATGHVARIQGRAAMAIRRLRESAALLRDGDFLNLLPACLPELAHASALLGDVRAAEAALAETEPLRLPSFRMDATYMGLAHAWTAAARGEISNAIAIALQTADAAARMGQRTFEAMALHDVARLGDARGVATRLKDLSRGFQGDLARAFTSHAEALMAGDAPGLEDGSRSFERMGGILYAAEAAAQASRLHRTGGEIGSAVAMAVRAEALAARCQGARTPSLIDIEPLPLTPREREVAVMAARGVSNREIADRLVLSIRTVQNHLHHAYEKLGVHSRVELGPLVDPNLPQGVRGDP